MEGPSSAFYPKPLQKPSVSHFEVLPTMCDQWLDEIVTPHCTWLDKDMDVSTTTPLSTMKGAVLVDPKYLVLVDQAQGADFDIPVIYWTGINKEPIEDWL
uniref:Uncharacterized protein n=1 Tax=Magallana gigas TaxID=29159 RepID=K1QUV9_MAGGI